MGMERFEIALYRELLCDSHPTEPWWPYIFINLNLMGELPQQLQACSCIMSQKQV